MVEEQKKSVNECSPCTDSSISPPATRMRSLEIDQSSSFLHTADRQPNPFYEDLIPDDESDDPGPCDPTCLCKRQGGSPFSQMATTPTSVTQPAHLLGFGPMAPSNLQRPTFWDHVGTNHGVPVDSFPFPTHDETTNAPGRLVYGVRALCSHHQLS